MIRKVKIQLGKRRARDYVAEEKEIRLFLNGKPAANVKLSPEHEEEFAVGYCLGEGLVNSFNSILKVEKKGNSVCVEAESPSGSLAERYISTDCTSGWRARSKAEKIRVASRLRVSSEEIIRNMRRLTKESKVWKKTGGVHSVALVNKKKFLLAEDVSRHAAVDKVIGMAAKRGIDFSSSYILCSGRLPGDMVIKAARINLPVVASRTAPLYSGIECAESTHLTLIGFVRGNKMNIYANPWRISTTRD